MIDKSLDTRICATNSLLGCTLQNKLFTSDLSVSLREVRFSEQEFIINKPILNIKYLHIGSQNNKAFHLFNDQQDYTLTIYFVESEITKDNVNKSLSNLLMAPFTKKLSYQNSNK